MRWISGLVRGQLALAFLVFSAIAAGTGCSGRSSACEAGDEGCACASGDRCFAGLSCVSGTCVDPTASVDGGTPVPGTDSGMPPPVTPDPDAFWADDPPPMQCLEDGTSGPPPVPPGGTPECPDDKNREGCRCDPIGGTAACWPGLRVNRNRGICQDGTTQCLPFDEFTGVWGPCNGYVLPVDGAVRGPGACRCFSAGTWALENLGPCFVTNSSTGQVAYTISTDPATGQCPAGLTLDPPGPGGHPHATWTNDTLQVDCEGRFELCYTLRAGNADDPQPTDCEVVRVCTGDFWYETRDAVQTLPPLPAWVSTNNACATQFNESGGYGEMSVRGLSAECDPIDDGSGAEYVFNRVNNCPGDCADRPTDPDCMNCGRGGSGTF